MDAPALDTVGLAGTVGVIGCSSTSSSCFFRTEVLVEAEPLSSPPRRSRSTACQPLRLLFFFCKTVAAGVSGGADRGRVFLSTRVIPRQGGRVGGGAEAGGRGRGRGSLIISGGFGKRTRSSVHLSKRMHVQAAINSTFVVCGIGLSVLCESEFDFGWAVAA